MKIISALASGIFLGISGCASSLVGLCYGRIAWRFHRYTILTLTFGFFGLCGLGLAKTLPAIAISVICTGIAEGILMPTVLNWMAAVTPREYLGRAGGGFSVALNMGQFASALAFVPILAVFITCGSAFFACGIVAFILALPCLFAVIKERDGLPRLSGGFTPRGNERL
jgi:MFS family permease